MSKILPIVCGVASLFSLAPGLLAEDLTYGEFGESTRFRRTVTTYKQLLPFQTVGYYPTLRYYGKDYTVHYQFVPVTRQTLRLIYETNPVILAPDEVYGHSDSARIVTERHRRLEAPSFRTTTVTTVTTDRPVTAPPSETVAPVPAPSEPAPAATVPAVPASSAPLQPALPGPAQTVIQPPAEAK